MTKEDAWEFANHWIVAWNAHDLDSILSHYDDAIELTSPVAARLLGTSDGKMAGKTNLRAYFQRGLAAYPELHFHLEDVLWGVNSIVLYYTNQRKLAPPSSWSYPRTEKLSEWWPTITASPVPFLMWAF